MERRTAPVLVKELLERLSELRYQNIGLSLNPDDEAACVFVRTAWQNVQRTMRELKRFEESGVKPASLKKVLRRPVKPLSATQRTAYQTLASCLDGIGMATSLNDLRAWPNVIPRVLVDDMTEKAAKLGKLTVKARSRTQKPERPACPICSKQMTVRKTRSASRDYQCPVCKGRYITRIRTD